MSVLQILFLVLWPLLSLISIIAVYKNKKHYSNERILLSIMFMVVPILPALFYLFVNPRAHTLLWSNSATKDKMYIAASDINYDSKSGDSNESRNGE